MVTKSRYIVEQKYDEENLLLYSTRTGKFAIISESVYKDIFDGFQEQYRDVTKRLEELGFVTEENEKEILEKKRKFTIEKFNSMPITNYVITPSMNCNARCSYCFESGAHHDDMSFEVAKDVVKYILDNSKGEPVAIHWFGGEPLMRTDIIDYISSELQNKKIDYISKITSNGYLVDESIIERAIGFWNVQIIQITLDDLDEKYDAIKRYVGNPQESPFKTVMNNIGMCLKNGLQVRIRINYNPIHIEKVKEILDYTMDCFNNNPLLSFHPQALFTDDIDIPGISGGFSSLDKHPFLRLREYEEECNAKRDENRGNIPHRSSYLTQFIPWCNFRVSANESGEYDRILKKYYLLPVPIHCAGICDNSVAIDSHGDIFVCQRMLGQSSEFASGNVKYGMLKNEVYHYYQSHKLVQKKCENCVLLPICQGGCKFKHQKYKTNQGCLPIKGMIKEAIRRAVSEIEEMGGEIEKII